MLRATSSVDVVGRGSGKGGGKGRVGSEVGRVSEVKIMDMMHEYGM